MFDKNFLYKIYDKYCLNYNKIYFIPLKNRNTNGIICVDNATGNTGISKCHKDDKYDAKIGCAIAYCRLKNIPIKETEDEEVKAGYFYNVNGKNVGYCYKISEGIAAFIKLEFNFYKHKYNLNTGSLEYYNIDKDSFRKMKEIDFDYFEPVDATFLNRIYSEMVVNGEQTKDVKFKFKDGCGVEAICYNKTWYNLTDIPEAHHIIRALAYAKLRNEGKSVCEHLSISYSSLKKRSFELKGKIYYIISAGLTYDRFPILYTYNPSENEFKQFSFETIKEEVEPSDAIFKLYR